MQTMCYRNTEKDPCLPGQRGEDAGRARHPRSRGGVSVSQVGEVDRGRQGGPSRQRTEGIQKAQPCKGVQDGVQDGQERLADGES